MLNTETHVEIRDVLIVGAGNAGIGMACHPSRTCPERSYAILERRRQGDRLPWRVLHHYRHDYAMLMDEPIEGGILRFDEDLAERERNAV